MKNIIITAIVSILATIFCFHAYFVYQIRNQVIQNTAIITQVVDFINKSIEANAPVPKPTE